MKHAIVIEVCYSTLNESLFYTLKCAQHTVTIVVGYLTKRSLGTPKPFGDWLASFTVTLNTLVYIYCVAG